MMCDQYFCQAVIHGSAVLWVGWVSVCLALLLFVACMSECCHLLCTLIHIGFILEFI